MNKKGSIDLGEIIKVENHIEGTIMNYIWRHMENDVWLHVVYNIEVPVNGTIMENFKYIKNNG
jgi:hypothetical protein